MLAEERGLIGCVMPDELTSICCSRCVRRWKCWSGFRSDVTPSGLARSVQHEAPGADRIGSATGRGWRHTPAGCGSERQWRGAWAPRSQAQADRFKFNRKAFKFNRKALGGWVQPHCLADNLLDLNAAQGLDAIGYQMQELVPLYAFHLTTFHVDENESRHLVGDLKLRFAGNLDIDFFSHLAHR